MDREERLRKRRARRKIKNNWDCKKYEKTKKGFLVRAYRNMKSRVEGVQHSKAHLYKGKEILEKHTFYEWALSNESFNKLFKEWEDSNYCRKLTPSVDRIDSSKGYTLDNMQYITHSENSRRGNISRYSKKRTQSSTT
jgi:hypothetical protein